MPRPARYTVDVLLDAAAELLAADGAAAVSMSAVARATGAPSGSVYHRFPTRSALCGGLWIRSEERAQDDLLRALGAAGSAQDRCVAGALSTLAWCRAHPVEAHVLLAGPEELGLSDWPDPLPARRRRLQRRFRKAVADIPGASGVVVDSARIQAALLDVPHAIVRRHLRTRQSIPATADALVADCARALIAAS